MIDTHALKGPLGWSLLSITFIVLYGIYACSSILSPLLTLSGSVEANSHAVALLEQHDQNTAIDIARFNGRSAFFQPIRKYVPPPPPPPPGPDDVDPVIVEPIPVAPLTYGGPDLIAIIEDEAWFRAPSSGADGVIRLKVGEEANGILLLTIANPAVVTVEFEGSDYVAEYSISLFNYDEPFFEADPPTEIQPAFFEEVETTAQEPSSS